MGRVKAIMINHYLSDLCLGDAQNYNSLEKRECLLDEDWARKSTWQV